MCIVIGVGIDITVKQEVTGGSVCHGGFTFCFLGIVEPLQRAFELGLTGQDERQFRPVIGSVDNIGAYTLIGSQRLIIVSRSTSVKGFGFTRHCSRYLIYKYRLDNLRSQRSNFLRHRL